MRIAHFRLAKPGAELALVRIAGMLESLRGVGGVVIVRSLSLLTVLYDEECTDPVAISDTLARWQAADRRLQGVAFDGLGG
jgi:hypothetical protein